MVPVGRVVCLATANLQPTDLMAALLQQMCKENNLYSDHELHALDEAQD